MTAEELYTIVIEKAKEFGMNPKNDSRTIIDEKGNAVIRKNIADEAFTNGTAFFALLNPEEETAGQYSDFSFVVFPEKNLGSCVITLGVGSSGFTNDYQLASHPGLRRTFLKLRTEDKLSFFKTSFDDIESTSSELLKEIRAEYPGLKKVIESYKTVLPAARIVTLKDDNKEETLNVIYRWLATYAKIRDWGTKAQRKVRDEVLDKIPSPELPNDELAVCSLLDKRHYVVLQGAPGTGKTYIAQNISKKYNKTFFEQFHAETTYSDFVYGIEPKLDDEEGESQFKPKKGVLYNAIKYAIDNENQKVLLIIDEINRANLSNVLGPVFYLFEYQSGKRPEDVKIKIGDMELEQLPEKLHFLATMNTADRSLAVVDFALRRRFAWYTLRPHIITNTQELMFVKRYYQAIADIFFEYASDEELNLQPGHSYFLVKDDNEMKDRLIYELLPLIKEYLNNGFLLKAKNSFYDFFLKEAEVMMYE